MTISDRWWSPWLEVGDSLLLHVGFRPDPIGEEGAFNVLDPTVRTRWNRFLVSHTRRQFALCSAALRGRICERIEWTNRDLSFGLLEHESRLTGWMMHCQTRDAM